MPINYQEIRSQVSEMGAKTASLEREKTTALQRAREVLGEKAAQNLVIREKVELAEANHRVLRCAAPTDELLTRVVEPLKTNISAILITSDGSQINPSRHDPVEFGLVNVGLFRMILESEQTPKVWTHSQLFYEGLNAEMPDHLNEDWIALKRDIWERELLASTCIGEQLDVAKSLGGEMLPVLALTDGPLELYGEPRNEESLRRMFKDYLKALNEMGERGMIAAGYVDKVRADLVVRMLELSLLSDDELRGDSLPRPFQGVTDAALFEQILLPGTRSAIFELVSNSAKRFREHRPRLRLHFFYLNVGYYQRDGRAKNLFARVEIPAWVAENPSMVDLLHASLVEQCRMLGTQPYPYALHRAHEIALVKFEEKDELLRLIQGALIEEGLPPGDYSSKQANKDASGNVKRYAR
ncbi:MAG: DNA double-strand break repair nuclease NurA [Anaerolineaceae bacterium]|nr:DNA double-strand break repair nuclease NurA [Anaerolineaceae bacterium]